MANLIFSRRALQQRLESLETVLTGDAHSTLIARTETPGRDRLAAMWEAAILSALHNVAPLRHENPLGDGSRPDFSLTYTDFEIIGDITSVSDKGLRENNPVDQFWLGIVRLARKYKLNPDHFRYEIDSRSDGEYGDSRTLLLLPTRKNLSAFLKAHVEPFIRGLVRNPVSRATFPYAAPGVAFRLTYNNSQKFGGGHHSSFDIAYSRTKTPVYTALRRKADQLRFAPSHVLRVIVLCDADCQAMSHTRSRGQGDYSASEVVRDFLRSTSAVDAVYLITTERTKPCEVRDQDLRLRGDLIRKPNPVPAARATVAAIAAIECLFHQAFQFLPKPMIDARNAALRSETRNYGLGFHGGYSMSMSSRTIRISSRQALELLAGALSNTEFDRLNGWDKDSANRGPFNLFGSALARGEMIESIAVIHGEDHDDDWLEFRFSESDPAISPFCRSK